jgi:hypothetical protein
VSEAFEHPFDVVSGATEALIERIADIDERISTNGYPRADIHNGGLEVNT